MQVGKNIHFREINISMKTPEFIIHVSTPPPPSLSTPSQQLHSAPLAALRFSRKFFLLSFCYMILQLLRSNLPFFLLTLFFPSDPHTGIAKVRTEL